MITNNVVFQGTSLVGSINGTANANVVDVIGNKEDTANATADVASVIGLLRYVIANLNSDADIAALIGALDTAAATGAVTDSDVLMAYIKQLVTELQVVDGLVDNIKVATDKVGTVTNSGGTATLGAILGDFANTTLVSKFAVPVEDAATDATIAQVVGKKSDTIAGTSIVALAKQVIAELAKVPKSDSNVTFNATALASILTQVNAATNVGSTFWIKKTVTSSAILEASNVAITGVSSVGELMVEDVIIKTDVTGLATGTNFELLTDNDKGRPYIIQEAVANMGSYQTIELSNASLLGRKTVIEVGKKLFVHSTVAACTGAGTIDIYVKFRRLTTGATIAAL